MTTVRATCGMLLHEMSGAFGGEEVEKANGGSFSGALASAVKRRMDEAEAARVAGDSTWWKLREATLLAVGTLDDFIVETGRALSECGRYATFSAPGFLGLVLDRDLAPGSENSIPPFLRGRALWVAARLAPGAPPAAATAVLGAALQSLDPRAPAPLRVGACRALAQYVPLAPKDGLVPFLGPAYQGLGTLLESEFNAGEASKAATSAGAAASLANDGDCETLHLVLEAMLVVVKSDAEAAAAWSGALAPATLRVWAAKVADPLLAADARDVLEALAAVPACVPSLHQLAVPTLSGVLASPDGQGPMLVESTLDLLAGLLKPAGVAEARAAHAACFRHVVALAVSSDDVGILQSCAECLRAFLRSGGVDSLVWGVDGVGGGGEVLRSYLDAVARLLSPSLEDGACVFAAPLLGQMLRRLRGEIAPLLPEIVSAVVTRVACAKQPNLVASLMSIFARLVHTDCDALLGLLAQMPVPPGGTAESGEDGVAPSRNALELVLRAWCGYQPDVSGAFDIKLTTSALATLLASGNPALDGVGVKGELVIETGEQGQAAIRTRAKARATGPDRYTTVPATAKVLELLADAVLEAQEAALAGGGGGEEDEWESDGDGDSDDDDDRRRRRRRRVFLRRRPIRPDSGQGYRRRHRRRRGRSRGPDLWYRHPGIHQGAAGRDAREGCARGGGAGAQRTPAARAHGAHAVIPGGEGFRRRTIVIIFNQSRRICEVRCSRTCRCAGTGSGLRTCTRTRGYRASSVSTASRARRASRIPRSLPCACR